MVAHLYPMSGNNSLGSAHLFPIIGVLYPMTGSRFHGITLINNLNDQK
jgi:hypothetical protein